MTGCVVARLYSGVLTIGKTTTHDDEGDSDCLKSMSATRAGLRPLSCQRTAGDALECEISCPS